MKKRKGFTLVELLVVISIIALLVSILMPALGKAREQAKDAICLVNTRSIGQTLQLYVMDFDDKFSPTWFYDDGTGALWSKGETAKVMWQFTAQDYYQDPEILLCSKNKSPDPISPAGGAAADQPGEFSNDEKDPWGPTAWMDQLPVLGNKYAEFGPAYAGKPVSGYIVNDWLGDTGAAPSLAGTRPNHWKKIQSQNANDIPMVLDGGWYSGWPDSFAIPSPDPLDKVQFNGDGAQQAMNRFTFSRHRGGTQAVFMDMSARRVSVKGLWKLKWHKNYDRGNAAATNPNYPWPAWIEELQQ